jgi:hypothetical protein
VKGTDECNAINTGKKARLLFANIAVRLRAQIVVKTRGMELRVVRLAQENCGKPTG